MVVTHGKIYCSDYLKQLVLTAYARMTEEGKLEMATDLILVNSFAPRQRIACDATLENGIALMRTYLEDQGFNVKVVDDLRVSSVENGVPSWCRTALRFLVRHQVALFKCNRILGLLIMLLAWPFHSYALHCRRKYMDDLGNKIAAQVLAENIPIVGIKVWNGEAYSWSVKVAQKIRQTNPETIIVAGGPQVKVYGENILEKQEFDLAIMGPGEEILEYFLRKRKEVSDKASFMGLVRREIGPERLIRTGSYSKDNLMFNSFVIPRYRAEDLEDKILMHTLVDGIGCTWQRCSFCSHTLQIPRYIPRPVEQIRDEIVAMSNQGISFFRFSCSDTPIGHGGAIAQMLLDEGIKVNYSMFFRSGKVSEQSFQTLCMMIKSGLRAVYIGGETGHDEILHKVMNKGLTSADIMNTVLTVKRASQEVELPCQVALSFIYPCPVVPDVSLQDIFDADIELIRKTMPDTVIINPPAVMPGTTWADRHETFGFRLGKGYYKKLMSYEYSLYKPYDFWRSQIEYGLNNLDVLGILRETARLSSAVEQMGIPLNIPDELMMMAQAIGFKAGDLRDFKTNTMVDVMTGTGDYLRQVTRTINDYSRQMAETSRDTRNKKLA